MNDIIARKFEGGELIYNNYGFDQELYSGIKDIEGIAVFDGDIISGIVTIDNRDDLQMNNLIVRFDSGAFWAVKTGMDIPLFILLCNVKNIKVIGNIHEDKEYLN